MLHIQFVDDKNNNSNNVQLFSMYHRDKDVIPGWLGGQITTQTRSETVTKEEEECNCIMLPLLGASPLCAVVATKDIKMGEEVIRMVEDNNDFEDETLHSNIMKEEGLIHIVAKRYKRQIASLRIHIEMAWKQHQCWILVAVVVQSWRLAKKKKKFINLDHSIQSKLTIRVSHKYMQIQTFMQSKTFYQMMNANELSPRHNRSYNHV